LQVEQELLVKEITVVLDMEQEVHPPEVAAAQALPVEMLTVVILPVVQEHLHL
jgi:hypothetical protein